MKNFSIFVKTVIICLIVAVLLPIEAHAASYDYVNDNTGLVYPNYADISDNYKIGDYSVRNGENLMFSGTECMFYKTNLTEKMILNSTGYEYSDPVSIKDKLGVPINVRLTWGMVAAYEKATNTVYVSSAMEEAYHTISTEDFMAVLNDDAAFYALQHKYRLETIALVKSLVAQRQNSSTNTSTVDALKTATVNTSDFNAYVYYTSNPDLQTAIGVDANALFNHWQKYVKAEGRIAK